MAVGCGTQSPRHVGGESDLWDHDGMMHLRSEQPTHQGSRFRTICPVRKSLFPENRRAELQIVTLKKEFDYPKRQDICHLYFFYRGLKGYAWYVPKSGEVVNIGGKSRYFKRSRTNIHDHLNEFLSRLVREGRLDESTASNLKYSGHPYYLFSYHGEIHKDRCLLVGDSAGLATVDLGEGIGPATEIGLRARSWAKPRTRAYAITRYSSGGWSVDCCAGCCRSPVIRAVGLPDYR